MNDNMVQIRAAIEFAKGSKVQTGYGYMSDSGEVDPKRPVELWITCRMTHVFALGKLLGIEGCEEYVHHGLSSLLTYLFDDENGGWFSSIETETDANGKRVVVDDRKEAYAHAFVLLAANSALAADDPDAGRLLALAIENQEERWFDPEVGRVRESFDREFNETEAYRGVNANMHTVEAYLATADVTGNREYLDRAVGILSFVAKQAQGHAWRIPEHYDGDWNCLPDYNFDQPAHPFRPFGATPGHGFEWSRLMLQARGSLLAIDGECPDWMLPSARALFKRAASDGWNVDGAPGFIYTTDFDGNPVTRQRMHWVVCEAIGAAIIMQKVLESEQPEDLELNQISSDIEQWSQYAKKYLIEAPGRWIHELDPNNHPASETWSGKPDVYHFFQMLLLPNLPVSPSFAAALRNSKV